MGQAEYNACIAAGGSAETCAVYLGGDEDTPTVSFGEILTDASGRQWKVQGQGAKGFRLFDPATKEVRSISGAFQTALGSYIQLDNRGNIVAASNSAPPGFPTGGTGGSFASTQAAQTQAEEAAKAAAQLAFQNSQTTLAQNHENALAILQQQLENSTGLQAQNIQANIDLENMRHENDLKELALQFENQLKTTLIGEIGAERRTLIQEQGATKRQLLTLGPDPFTQGAALQGQAQRGTTPQQAAVGQAQAFINQPLPQASMSDDIAQLESVLAGIQGSQAPQLTGGFGLTNPPGLAHGGVIEMGKNGGTFSAKPSKQAFLVGDGGGIVPGVTEVLTVGQDKRGAFTVEVTPLMGGAQGGLDFTLSGLQSLAPLFGGAGFSQIPRAQLSGGVQTADPRLVRFGDDPEVFFIDPLTGRARSATSRELFGQSGFNIGDVEFLDPGQRESFQFGPGLQSPFGFRPETLSRLGINPELVKFGGDETVFFRNPQTGNLQSFGSLENFQQSGFSFGDVSSLAESSRGAFSFGAPLTGPLGPPTPTTATDFRATGVPLIEPITGALLPEPFKVAATLADWRVNNPFLYNLALQAYRSAGRSGAVVEAQTTAATPQGRFGAGQRIGFQGARF
ncbi:hypothetical protein LCGC14_0979110 [marine sediment metagenome]|uniref:Uncharacterized protein n=1 Tax=marine sediment metagenome TaxID=412755 RepID=A0A0F9QSN0_9ZZZZ